jgi:hypothetical protein
MGKKLDSSSSSSDEDDERLRQLKESTITFESLNESKKSANNSQTNSLPSKRTDLGVTSSSSRNDYFTSSSNSNQRQTNQIIDENDSDDLNNFKISPEFQAFVAKKLQKKLDE